MIIKGKISERYENQQQGYIIPDSRAMRIKFHFEDIKGNPSSLAVNDRVVFQLSKDETGQSLAIKIEKLRYLNPLVIIAVWFYASLAGCVWYFNYPIDVFYYYTAINILMMPVVWLDKRAKKLNKPKTGKGSYLFLSLLGGWVCNLVFHYIWHLKQSSIFYQTLLFFIIAGHVLLFGWTLTANGTLWLEQQLVLIKASIN